MTTNEILFCLLIMALLYYFLFYLPEQQNKNTVPPSSPSTKSTATQTVNADEKELEKTLDILIKNIQQLNHQIN